MIASLTTGIPGHPPSCKFQTVAAIGFPQQAINRAPRFHLETKLAVVFA